jgi:hypothetical protein
MRCNFILISLRCNKIQYRATGVALRLDGDL